MKDVGAEAGAGRDGGASPATGPLVVEAEGAGGEGGRLAAAAVGFGVAAEGIFAAGEAHGGPFLLNA